MYAKGKQRMRSGMQRPQMVVSRLLAQAQLLRQALPPPGASHCQRVPGATRTPRGAPDVARALRVLRCADAAHAPCGP